MSWQSYVDVNICGVVKCKVAIIASLDTGAIWAKQDKSENQVSQAELKAIADTIKANPKSFQETGIHLAGEKYFCLQAEQNVIRGRRNSAALSIVATRTCLLVVVTTDGFPPGILNNCVEKLGEHFVTSNY